MSNQDRQSDGPDLDRNALTLTMFLKEFYEKLVLKTISRGQQKHEKLSSMQRVNCYIRRAS